MYDVAKNNPVITSASAVSNYTFLTVDGDLYLISNVVTGDNAFMYIERIGLHETYYCNIAYGSGETYASITAGTTLLTVDSNGKLAIASSAPASGVYFKVTDKCTLTGKAVKIKVMVVDAT